MSAAIPIIAAAAGGAGCGSWAIFRRARRSSAEPIPVRPQPTGVRVLDADEVRDVALRAAASEMHLARRIYERSLHFECLSSSGLGEPLIEVPKEDAEAGFRSPRTAPGS